MWINPNCLHLEESRTVASNTYVTCDKCGKEIIVDRTILKIETGPRRHEAPVDLCTRCMSMFRAYVGREKIAATVPVGTPATM
jgi:hypothetical protein